MVSCNSPLSSSVLVSSSTHQLTGDFFDYSFLGEQAIKGFNEPVLVWKALRESATESRFAAAHAAAAGPMVGRERELAFLYDAWQRATQGDGHVMLLAGEAGMGKSRLLEALVERVRPEPHRLLRCQCSPYHRNSVLFPRTSIVSGERLNEWAGTPVHRRCCWRNCSRFRSKIPCRQSR